LPLSNGRGAIRARVCTGKVYLGFAVFLLSISAGMHLVDIVRDLKANSSRFMKTKAPLFAWQDAGISVSPSQIEAVKRYIARQAEHHSKRTFDDDFSLC
jgi:putative transposase